jgi:uncharacterized damage-inducible protein DinB
MRHHVCMTTNLQQLFRHNLWANRLILDAGARISPDQLEASVVGTYGPIGRTLAHMVSAEDSYAARLAARPRRYRWDEAAPAPSVAELRTVLESVGPELIELAGSTRETLVVEVLREGQPVPLPGWIILTQVIDHGREHRTHIATILTQLGIQPPDMDGWQFQETGAAAEG